jgi:hypothetical protein
MGFQSAAAPPDDGVVGPATWAALDDLDMRVQAGDVQLTDDEITAISDAAQNSSVAQYNWPDRGRAPAGYIIGMCLAYADAIKRSDEALYDEISQGDRDDADEDVLSWYRDELDDLGWNVDDDGVEPLRAVFAIMIGLGMRESSGQYCEGRDQSATNTSADTAEAGLFQTSWNIRSCSSTIAPLLEEFWDNPNGYLDYWRKGVTPSGTDLKNFGSDDGAMYQFLSKYAPLFHVYVTAIGLRYLRQHWGPVNRKEITLLDDAYELLQEIERLLDAGPGPSPEEPQAEVEVGAIGNVTLNVNGTLVEPVAAIGPPTVTIDITSTGGVRVVVDGKPYSDE